MIDSNVLIAGASSGIGRACAITLSRHFRVFALARREEKLEELREYGIEPVVFDLNESDRIEPLCKSLAKEHGAFRAFVVAAGVQKIKPLRVLKPKEIEEIFRINLYAPMLFAKAFASRSVHTRENPSITFVSSIAGEKPEKGILAYSASKAALDNLTKGLAKEIAPIRVNAVAPGFLETEMTRACSNVYTPEFIEKISGEYPLGLADVQKVADLIEFLISEKADYITGTVIRVDGGGAL